MDLQEVYDKIEEVVMSAQSLHDVTQVIKNLSELAIESKNIYVLMETQAEHAFNILHFFIRFSSSRVQTKPVSSKNQVLFHNSTEENPQSSLIHIHCFCSGFFSDWAYVIVVCQEEEERSIHKVHCLKSSLEMVR